MSGAIASMNILLNKAQSKLKSKMTGHLSVTATALLAQLRADQ